MSFVCLSLTGETLEENLTAARRYRSAVDMYELRADFLRPDEQIQANRFPDMVQKPVILTIRRRSDGGRFIFSEEERTVLFRRALSGPFSYIDLESDYDSSVVEETARKSDIRIIRSEHDYSGSDGDLVGRVNGLPHARDELPKLAVAPQSGRQLLNLLKAYEQLRNREKIVVGIGEFGFPTRVLAFRLGSLVTYCSPPERSAAPGHIDPNTLHDVYRISRITEKTDIFGIIGNPVLHSKSPLIHNEGYRQTGKDAVYLPFPMDDVSVFFDIADILPVQGASVTMPFKQDVIPFTSEVSKEVEVTKACNTIVRKKGGWVGYNFDCRGFILPLQKTVGRDSLKGLRVSVIGAGGAAQSVLYALTLSGASVCVFNRTVEKAARLADQFGCEYAGLDEQEKISRFSDIIVQTTGVGMHPLEDENPVPRYSFRGSEIVYDLIYAPPQTVFLTKAREAGCTILNGEQMLFEQAKEQFARFTGESYPEQES